MPNTRGRNRYTFSVIAQCPFRDPGRNPQGRGSGTGSLTLNGRSSDDKKEPRLDIHISAQQKFLQPAFEVRKARPTREGVLFLARTQKHYFLSGKRKKSRQVMT